jgi:predicted HTH transcriptional regulator
MNLCKSQAIALLHKQKSAIEPLKQTNRDSPEFANWQRDVEIKGLSGDLQQQNDRIVNTIRNAVVPQSEVKIERCTLNGKRIIAAFVTEEHSAPYGLDAAKARFMCSGVLLPFQPISLRYEHSQNRNAP